MQLGHTSSWGVGRGGGGGVKLATAAGRSRVHTTHRHHSVNNRLQARKADKTQPTRQQRRLLAKKLSLRAREYRPNERVMPVTRSDMYVCLQSSVQRGPGSPPPPPPHDVLIYLCIALAVARSNPRVNGTWSTALALRRMPTCESCSPPRTNHTGCGAASKC